MNSTEVNKIAGAVIGAVLVFMLLGFFSGKVYGTRGHQGGEPQAFMLEIAETETASAEEEVTVDYAALIASADLDAGKKVFNKCKACHKVEDGANGAGPHLWGVVDRPKEAVDGFGYSGALAAVGGAWDFAALNAFLEKPKTYAPGTSMGFAGLKKPEDRVNVIAWLNAEDGTPVDLSAGMEKAEAPVAEETEVAAAPAVEAEAPAPEAAAVEAPAETTEAPAKTETAAAPAVEEPAQEEPAETTEAPAETEVAAAGAYPAGDAKAGAKVFRKCRACHKMEDGKNGVGPHLWGVINRDIASVEGFGYSGALEALPGTWTATELAAFLTNPKKYAKGTKM
ncbi:MAG: cytochrome c family protein, partial [Paracoccaceae bacterium]